MTAEARPQTGREHEVDGVPQRGVHAGLQPGQVPPRVSLYFDTFISKLHIGVGTACQT
jgi:hypothetical protein